ncbi:integrase core domain protein [Ostertagia ostertagi]
MQNKNRVGEQQRKLRVVNNRSVAAAQCTCCGGRGHAFYQCFKKQTAFCSNCSRPGHMAKACRSKRFSSRNVLRESRKVSRRVNWCAEPSTSDLDESDISHSNIVDRVSHRERQGRREELDKSRLQAQESGRIQVPEVGRSAKMRRSGDQSLCQKVKVEPATMLKINIHGTDVSCELDTGASVSILDVASWRKIGKPPMTEATIEATAYNNSPIYFCGKCTVWVQFNGRRAKMDLHVLEGATRTLCGRDMIKALEIDCGPYYQRVHGMQEKPLSMTQGGEKWLIIVDAKSKWPEVIRMGLTTAEKTIEKLRMIFATHGLPEQVVSDNGPPFSSTMFKEFCKGRNIELILTSPYHPNSNGEAERFVQTFKKGWYKGLRDGKKAENVLVELLFEYRVTPHRATGKSPAELLMGRELRTTLDIRKTENKAAGDSAYRRRMIDDYNKRGRKERTFLVGQQVYLRNYQKGDKWIPGIVTGVLSRCMYNVHVGTGSRKAHADQLKERPVPEQEVMRAMRRSEPGPEGDLPPRRSARTPQAAEANEVSDLAYDGTVRPFAPGSGPQVRRAPYQRRPIEERQVDHIVDSVAAAEDEAVGRLSDKN